MAKPIHGLVRESLGQKISSQEILGQEIPGQGTLGQEILGQGLLAAGDPFDHAFAEARRAAAAGEVPVGAVVVRDGRILAAAHNRPRALHDPTAHAEILAIRAACAAIGSERLPGCDLYVTLEPCPMCAGAIGFARIRRLYFGASDPKGGGVEHGPRVFNQTTCHHAPEVYGGFREGEAADLLRAFFAERRD